MLQYKHSLSGKIWVVVVVVIQRKKAAIGM